MADVTPQPHDFDHAAQWMLRHRRRANEGHLYRPLLKLAQMFWTGTGPQPSPGRTETFAFLFDMNQLFEEFIAEFIRRELREVWQTGATVEMQTQSNRPSQLRTNVPAPPQAQENEITETCASPESVALPAILPATTGCHSELVEESMSFPRWQAQRPD